MKIWSTMICGAALYAASGCSTTDLNNAFVAGAGSVLEAATLDKAQVQAQSKMAVRQLDRQARIAPAGTRYAQRLARLTQGLDQYQGLALNFAVYIDDSINAFATPDGSVRVHTGLMDRMSDDQVLAVIGHEIGHVVQEHSYQQMRKAMLARGVRQAIASTESGALAAGMVGELSEVALNARFSQQDELASDRFAVAFLRERGVNPDAMRQSLMVLLADGDTGGGFLSSHPSSQARIDALR
ncbi:MAG: M48 family metalloprotease [Gammaproteobacteria bacterium]|nr:M48 family metalloprotease [Gammaproteobacteria bacterium]